MSSLLGQKSIALQGCIENPFPLIIRLDARFGPQTIETTPVDKQFTMIMAEDVQCMSPSRRKVFALSCEGEERGGVERAQSRYSSKYPVPIVFQQEKISKRFNNLKTEDRWNDSAGDTIDLFDSSFGRTTPSHSIDDDQNSVEVDSASHKKSIHWSTIDIHIHETILGDNVPSSGPPVGIGWRTVEHRHLSIDEFEQQRPARRVRTEMLTPSHSRLDDLMELGLSFRELREACQLAATIRRQRQKSSKDGRLLLRIGKLFSQKSK